MEIGCSEVNVMVQECRYDEQEFFHDKERHTDTRSYVRTYRYSFICQKMEIGCSEVNVMVQECRYDEQEFFHDKERHTDTRSYVRKI